ncbi:MAG TPA: zf-HC2 domain-containing protein [Acidobacteriaceae bacterium]|nr:zf-HC2 domain-containing protein [Acidobacteriaceae bacterium]
MDHEHALRISAVERYLLNELPQPECDEFEAHFFDCPHCALDLRAGLLFLEEAKKNLAARAPAGRGRKTKPFTALLRSLRMPALWKPALLAPVLALLLFVAYRDTTKIHQAPGIGPFAVRDTPKILPVLSLAQANSRGGEIPSFQSSGKPFLVQFDIPGDDRYQDYTCSLLSPAGDILWEVQVSPEQAKDTVSLEIPPMQSGKGVYSLRVQGNSSTGQVAIARYRFALQQPN